MTVAGKVIVITGASMGIGEAIAALFAARGANVVLSARDLARVEAARARIALPERTFGVACNVRDRSEIDRLLASTLERFGRVDIWINNAGYGLQDSVAAMSIENCRALFDTNFFGAIACMQAVIPVMKQQGGGTIINVSSVAGHIAVPYMAAYCASKSALNAVGRAARLELKTSNIQVITVCPGYVATDFAEHSIKGVERKRLGAAARRGISAERVARAVLRGYLRRSREVIVPWQDRLVIFFYQRIPRLMEFGMARMLRPAEEVIAEARAAREK
jgi:short-subunit dehydrogenase